MLDATKCAKITLVLRHDYPGQVCSIAKSLEVDRRALVAADRPRRDATATAASASSRRSLGVARNVLSARLQRLVEEDILERRAYQESPQRYEYFLTEKGLDLWPALIALLGWGDRYSPEPDGPPMLIVHKECGGAVSDRGICEALRRGPPRPRRPRRPRSRRRWRDSAPPRQLAPRASVGWTASRATDDEEERDGDGGGASGHGTGSSSAASGSSRRAASRSR